MTHPNDDSPAATPAARMRLARYLASAGIASRRRCEEMIREGLIHGESHYPISLTLITAGLLWLFWVLFQWFRDSVRESESGQYGRKSYRKLAYLNNRADNVHYNRILVIEDGQIAEIGTHSELLKKGGKYYRLFTKQFRNQMEQVYDPFKELGGAGSLPLALE